MRKLLFAALPLAACGSFPSGPAEISTGGLTYDVRNGGSFVGLPLTPQIALPTGTASYTGVYQMQQDEFLEKGDATLNLDMNLAEFELQMRAEFPAEANVQIVDLTYEGDVVDGRLEDSSFELDLETGLTLPSGGVSADFYGATGEVIAGSYNQWLGAVGTSDFVSGTFIVEAE